jgi:trk system potassium uptake protein TrkH
MRLGVVLQYLGNLLFFLGMAMLLPLLWALHAGEAWRYFLLASGITMGSGLLFRRWAPPGVEINHRESFAIAALGWLLAALFGSLPFIFAGVTTGFSAAFFESMSGFTTTGLTVLADIQGLPEGILLWRSLTHWLGGMGIIVLSVAMLSGLGAGGMQLFKAEVPGPSAGKLLPRAAASARILYLVYMGLSLLQVVLLFFGGASFFEALTHSFATMGTGGISTKNLSVAAFDSIYIETVIIAFMFLAGTNFSLHYRALWGRSSAYWRDSEFKFYTTVIGFASFLVTLNLFWNQYGSLFLSLRHAVFQVVSLVSTTGFISADFSQWPSFSRGILFVLMFFGGCAGSTAGAIKQVRILVLVKYGGRELRRLLHPRAVIPLRLGDRVVPDSVVEGIIGFLFLYGVILALTVLFLSSFNLDLLDSISIAVATLGNIGPGFGVIDPLGSYGEFPALAKYILSFVMLLGRLEIFTVLLLFLPDYWQGARFSRWDMAGGHQL